MSQPGFAIIDLETTGLRPKSDRVVEMAIVRTDAWGRPLAELSTLVNPTRAVGATSIHGITNADVREAPPFREIAGRVFDLLRGAVVVSHNLPFDARFLDAELRRMQLPSIQVAGVCTLQESVRWLQPLFGRSLVACCERIGHPLVQHHHALADARAASHLLNAIGRERRRVEEVPFRSQLERATATPWPDLHGRAELVPRDLASYRRATRRSAIAGLVDRLPATGNAGIEAEAYLLALDEAIEDRTVTADEAEALRELAIELGVGSADLPRIHFTYLTDLACAAVADGIVTTAERADLETVATLLGFPQTAVAAALDAATRMPTARTIAGRRPLEPGMKVCFSDVHEDKARLEALATAAGLVVRTQVSKQTDVVVTGEPLSQSAKLEKARSLATRIMIESVFIAMMTRSDTAAPPPEPGAANATHSASNAAAPQASAWAPGWYVDPTGAPGFRYWDGARWTGHVSHSR